MNIHLSMTKTTGMHSGVDGSGFTKAEQRTGQRRCMLALSVLDKWFHKFVQSLTN
jgi:hypothetical protein